MQALNFRYYYSCLVHSMNSRLLTIDDDRKRRHLLRIDAPMQKRDSREVVNDNED